LVIIRDFFQKQKVLNGSVYYIELSWLVGLSVSK